MVEAITKPTYETINGINCLLELGSWTPTAIDLMLDNVGKQHCDPSARLFEIIQNFNGTKFGFESMSPIPEKGFIRIRLEYMDCVTYI